MTAPAARAVSELLNNKSEAMMQMTSDRLMIHTHLSLNCLLPEISHGEVAVVDFFIGLTYDDYGLGAFQLVGHGDVVGRVPTLAVLPKVREQQSLAELAVSIEEVQPERHHFFLPDPHLHLAIIDVVGRWSQIQHVTLAAVKLLICETDSFVVITVAAKACDLFGVKSVPMKLPFVM